VEHDPRPVREAVGTFLIGLRLVVVLALLVVVGVLMAGLALFVIVLILSFVIGFF